MDQTMRKLIHRLVDHQTIPPETAEELLQRILEALKNYDPSPQQRKEDTLCRNIRNG